jgi:hypothetical protein
MAELRKTPEYSKATSEAIFYLLFNTRQLNNPKRSTH